MPDRDDRRGRDPSPPAPGAEEPVHDVLAAEEFALGAADPQLHEEPVHDVLAAEEFVVGTGDPALGRGPFDVPASPSAGGDAPREVLAADAFAVPAGRHAPRGTPAAAAGRGRRLRVAVGAAVVTAFVWRRRR